MPIKDLVSLQPALAELERALRWAADTTDNLPFKLVPVIQTQGKKSKCNGWFSPDQWSTREGELCHEITFCAEVLDRDIVDIVATAVHEVVHLWTHFLELKDVSTGGRHNKVFKEYAEILGLECAKPYDAYGWGYTAPSDELRERIEKEFQPDVVAFNLFRIVKPRTTPTVKTNAWVCECTGLTLRIPAQQTLDATCHKCKQKFVPKEPEVKAGPGPAASDVVRHLADAINRIGVDVFEAHYKLPDDGHDHPDDYPFHTHNMVHEEDRVEGDALDEAYGWDHRHSDEYPLHQHEGRAHGNFEVEDDGGWNHDSNALYMGVTARTVEEEPSPTKPKPKSKKKATKTTKKEK